MSKLVNESTCKRISKTVNSIPKKSYGYDELTKLLKQFGCPYVVITMNYLTNVHGVFDSERKKIITIPNEPIHYMVFFNHIRNKLLNEQSQKVSIEKRPTSISISKSADISIYSDSELVAELRKRGFEIIAKKVIEL